MISFTSIIIALCIYLWWENRKEKRAKREQERKEKNYRIAWVKHCSNLLNEAGCPDIQTSPPEIVREFLQKEDNVVLHEAYLDVMSYYGLEIDDQIRIEWEDKRGFL